MAGGFTQAAPRRCARSCCGSPPRCESGRAESELAAVADEQVLPALHALVDRGEPARQTLDTQPDQPVRARREVLLVASAATDQVVERVPCERVVLDRCRVAEIA